MARPTAPVADTKIEFGEFVAPEVTNPYIDDVKKLAEFDNPDAAMNVTVDVNAAQRTRIKIQQAANEVGKTARLRATDDSKVKEVGTDEDGEKILEGNVVLKFTLTGRHKSRRASKPTTQDTE